jgi:hypothetical protein
MPPKFARPEIHDFFFASCVLLDEVTDAIQLRSFLDLSTAHAIALICQQPEGKLDALLESWMCEKPPLKSRISQAARDASASNDTPVSLALVAVAPSSDQPVEVRGVDSFLGAKANAPYNQHNAALKYLRVI